MNNKGPFLSFEEQMLYLKNKGLNFVDLGLYKILETHNFQSILHFYNRYFYEDDSKNYENSNYRKNITSKMLVDFIKFDNYLSYVLIEHIHFIERRLNQIITNEIGWFLFQKRHITSFYEMPRLPISSITQGTNYTDSIERKLQDNYQLQQFYFLKREILSSTISYDDFKHFFKNATKNIKEEKILKNQNIQSNNDFYYAPIYKIMPKLDFGSLIHLFQLLNRSLQTKIIHKLILDASPNLQIETWIFILDQIRLLRNRISHNETIVNFEFDISTLKRNRYKQKRFFSKINSYLLDDYVFNTIKKDLKTKLFFSSASKHSLSNLFKIFMLINWNDIDIVSTFEKIKEEFNKFQNNIDVIAKRKIESKLF